MKRRIKLKRLLPHATAILSLMVLTFFVIDRFNEFMAFMTSELSKWVFAALAASALATSIRLIALDWKEEHGETGDEEHTDERK